MLQIKNTCYICSWTVHVNVYKICHVSTAYHYLNVPICAKIICTFTHLRTLQWKATVREGVVEQYKQMYIFSIMSVLPQILLPPSFISNKLLSHTTLWNYKTWLRYHKLHTIHGSADCDIHVGEGWKKWLYTYIWPSITHSIQKCCKCFHTVEVPPSKLHTKEVPSRKLMVKITWSEKPG